MNENKTALLKIFSAVLKDRSKTEPQYQSISSEMVKYFSRKELIEIITHIYQDEETPWQNNLVEMENEELLLLIRDDYSIISYVTSKWSKEVSQLPTFQEWMHSKVHPDSENVEENSGSKSEETQTEISEHTPKTEMDSENQNLEKHVSESPKPEEKPSSKKPEKVKNT